VELRKNGGAKEKIAVLKKRIAEQDQQHKEDLEDAVSNRCGFPLNSAHSLS
jgi:hypothetical protein